MSIDHQDVPEGWELTGGVGEGSLRRRFEFADFAEAWRFMEGVAAEAERLQHHPDWSNSWNVVTVELRSHDAGAVTDRDLALANAIDAVHASMGAPPG
jgi:4a-hydroxytetrahydrobiopterin dehydratase